jgi:hypothetical protein
MQILDNHLGWKSAVECIGRKETFVIKMGIYSALPTNSEITFV